MVPKPIFSPSILLPGGLPFLSTNELSTEVERCIKMREADEDRSADEQRAGRGGLEVVTLYPLPDVRNGLLKSN